VTASHVDYVNFKARFDDAYAKLKLPPDCTEEITPTATNPGIYNWTFDWLLVFKDDNRYLRAPERYGKVAGLQLSRRIAFTFHYGPIIQRDVNGKLIWQNTDSVDIRIDKIRGEVHMHYQAPNPHYGQGSIQGLTLESVDMLKFVRAVLQHRRSGKPLDEILGFKIG
jgi:hypothetical protein